jgi:2-polyprenyl-3-methyl-5-hydroxy-6-metoxy-1,4-benzoquinol methylase
MTPDPCPICQGPSRQLRLRLYDDRYGQPGTYTAFKCHRCGHVRLAASFTEAELAELYTARYPRANTKWEKLQPLGPASGLRAWLAGERSSAFRWVPEGVTVLDIGCGFGQTIEYHQARGCDAIGIEPDAHAVEEAQRHGLPVRHGIFHASDFLAASFDYVTMDQVIEHALDPLEFLGGVAKVLRPGGTAVVSTPNGEGYGARLFGERWINWHAPYHLNLFTRASIRHLAKRTGLQVRWIRTLTASDWALYQWFHWFTRPAEETPSPFWDAGRTPLAVPRRVGRIATLVQRAQGFRVVARATDALGIGDNLLAVIDRPASN